MTAIPILTDWEILLDDETTGGNAVAGMRTVRRIVGAGTTVYTTNALYSAVADAMDDFIAMGFTNAMLPVTPNAYTMENKYFIPKRDTEFLKEGAIDADWTVTAGDGVYRKLHDNTGTAPVDGDRGRQVTEATSGDTGTLLDFETSFDGDGVQLYVLWIRPDTSGDTFALSTALTTTGDGGTMSVTGTAAATSGQSLWSSIQAIGSVPTATDVYVYQNRNKLTDYTGGFQWWATDPTLSLGIIDILVRVIEGGVTIADGDVEVFARKYTSLYDNFRLNVVGGGRSALPLASGPDINNTTGYRTTGTLSGVTGTFTVGNGIYQGATWATATARGVITETNTNTDLEYYLVGDLTDLSSTTSTQEYDFATQADGDADATTGTVGINLTGPTDATAGEGGTVTLALGGFLVDHDGIGGTEPYSIQVDCIGDVAITSVYEFLKYTCRRGQITDMITGMNVPGESYRGLDGITEYDTPAGVMTEGDDINVNGGTWTARLLHQNTTNSPTYISFTDQQTSTDALANNDVIWEEGQSAANQVLVNDPGTLGIVNFTSPKSSPFGTFTGTQIFGARGVSFINIDVNPQAYILTDDLGVLRTPPNTVTFTVSNTAALDRVLVARDTGVDGIINKNQFGGIATAAASGTTITVTGTIDPEVPNAGFVRIVSVDEQEEHHYEYSSRTAGASGVFTLKAVTPGTATAGTTTVLLEDTGADFVTDGVTPGMLVQNTTAGFTFEVVSVTDLDTLVIVPIFGTGHTFVSTDAYTINELIRTYDTSDQLYDLIIDQEATGTTVTNTLVKTPAANFDVVVNVRQGKVILPFTTNTVVNDTGGSASTVRALDTIAT